MYCARGNESTLSTLDQIMYDRIFVIFGLDRINEEHHGCRICPEYRFESHESRPIKFYRFAREVDHSFRKCSRKNFHFLHFHS